MSFQYELLKEKLSLQATSKICHEIIEKNLLNYLNFLMSSPNGNKHIATNTTTEYKKIKHGSLYKFIHIACNKSSINKKQKNKKQNNKFHAQGNGHF